jgi:hypothetical protein
MTYIPERDFIVREVPFPYCVKSVVTPNNDGSFSIYINAKLSPDQKRKAFEHEKDHIINDDFYNDLPIEEIERR